MPDIDPIRQQWLTLAFVLTVTVVVVGFDVWTIRTNGVNSSISRVMRQLFEACPTIFVAIVFWVGILIGHIWMPVE